MNSMTIINFFKLKLMKKIIIGTILKNALYNRTKVHLLTNLNKISIFKKMN